MGIQTFLKDRKKKKILGQRGAPVLKEGETVKKFGGFLPQREAEQIAERERRFGPIVGGSGGLDPLEADRRTAEALRKFQQQEAAQRKAELEKRLKIAQEKAKRDKLARERKFAEFQRKRRERLVAEKRLRVKITKGRIREKKLVTRTQLKKLIPKRITPIRFLKQKTLQKTAPKRFKKLLIKTRDITTLGLTREARQRKNLNKDVESFNKRAKSFDKKFGGKELTEKEFNEAIKEQAKLNKSFDELEKREKNIKEAIPTKAFQFTQSRLEKLRKRKLEIIEKKGVKSVIDPEFKKIDQKLSELGAAQSFISAGISFLLLPETILKVVTNPSELKKIPSSLKQEGIKFGKIAAISPSEAVARIGAEVLILKGTGSALKITGKLTGKTAAKITGKLAKVKGTQITIPSGQLGKKAISIKIARPGLKKISVPLREQAKLIGKKVPIVTSAQADELLGFVRRKRIIRKPIPNEKLLSSSTKKLLKKFDTGKITKKQLIALDRAIKIETKGAGSILERSFFVDPEGRVRVSRLGIQREASIADIFKGDFTFRSQKPQILVFEDIKVQAFPKTKIFNSIKKKLKVNKALTKAESNALINFQTKVSGKFKPIGALSKEPELTLAPGEIFKKIKTIAKVEINGKLVSIVKAKVVKSTKSTRNLLKKAKSGKITTKELRILRRKLKKETGFKTPKVSRRALGRPRVPIKRIGISTATRIRRRKRKRIIKRALPRKPRRPVKRPVKRPLRPRRPRKPRKLRRPVKRPIKRPSKPRRPGRPPRTPGRPITPPTRPARIIKLPRKIKIKKRKRKSQSFDVFARPLKKTKKGKRPKLVKVNRVPLTRKKAKDLRNFIADQSLSRTARIKPTSGRPMKPRLKVPRGYSSRTKGKFRRFKIRKGKRITLPKGKVIEKSRHLLDTRSEKSGISLRRKIAQLSKPLKKKVIKRKSVKRITTQRRILRPQRTQVRQVSQPKRKVSQEVLDNLAKGRAIRMRNLNRRK